MDEIFGNSKFFHFISGIRNYLTFILTFGSKTRLFLNSKPKTFIILAKKLLLSHYCVLYQQLQKLICAVEKPDLQTSLFWRYL